MKKTTDLVKVFTSRVRYPIKDIDTAFNKQFQQWLYYNSHEQEPLPESKDGIKRFKFDVNGNITNVSFSGKTKDGFDLLEQDFIDKELKRLNSIDVQNLDLTKQKYIEFLKEYFENKVVKIEQEKGNDLGEIENNFDNVPIEDVYQYFKKELVDKKRIEKKELISYLKCAFDKQNPPTKKFTIKKRTKKEIRKVFYNYYEKKAGKPHGRLEEYLNLLKDYFIGFETEDYTNFSKIY